MTMQPLGFQTDKERAIAAMRGTANPIRIGYTAPDMQALDRAATVQGDSAAMPTQLGLYRVAVDAYYTVIYTFHGSNNVEALLKAYNNDGSEIPMDCDTYGPSHFWFDVSGAIQQHLYYGSKCGFVPMDIG